MRILFISAFYPPFVIGGWEQLVRDINENLQARGHITHVLTSLYGVNRPSCEKGVDRFLSLESDIYHYKPLQFLMHEARLKKNLMYVKDEIEDFNPDIVFIHVMWNLSKGVAWMAEQLCPGRIVYYVANDWPYATDLHSAYWRDHANNKLLDKAKQLLSQVPLKIVEKEKKKFHLEFRQVLCVSQAIKNNLVAHANIDQGRIKVVYNGVEDNLFVPPRRLDKPGSKQGLSLLYAGSLVSHKGVHTAIEAMKILSEKPDTPNITLSITGSGHPDYEAYLKKLVVENRLGEKVHFLQRIPREEMPSLLQKFDILVFPSIWEEPLARVMQEAMATGLVVVGTLTGGSGELLIEGETGLTFEPDNPYMLAQKVEQLYKDPDLQARLSRNGRNKVVSQFSMRRMIDEIETSLVNVAHDFLYPSL